MLGFNTVRAWIDWASGEAAEGRYDFETLDVLLELAQEEGLKHSAFVDRDVPWRAALLDFTRSFGYDQGRRGFWVGELQGGFGTISVNVSPTVTPDDLRIWTWTALSRGAKGINY